MESRSNNIQEAYEANQKKNLLENSIRSLFMTQIEIEKINNSIETKFLEFMNFLQVNKITNDILPQNSIRDEYLFNYQYSQILNSLTDNYKSYCDASNKDKTNNSKAFQENFKNANLKQIDNYQSKKNIYIPNNINNHDYPNFSNLAGNNNNNNNNLNHQMILGLTEGLNEHGIDSLKYKKLGNAQNKLKMKTDKETDLIDAVEGSNFSNPENNIIKTNNNNLIFYDSQNPNQANNLNFKSINDNCNEANEKCAVRAQNKYVFKENKVLKQKFLEALAANKNNKKHFQVVYMFKKRIKRMFRIDCMTRKINVNFFHYLKENEKRLNLDPELINLIRNNIRYTSKNKFQIYEEKYPNFRSYYEEFLESQKFKDLINTIKNKYDYEYVKLFFRHSLNFLHYYLK